MGSKWFGQDLQAIAGAGCVASASFLPAAGAYGAADVIDVAKEFPFVDRNGLAIPAGSLIRVLATILKIDQSGLQASEGAYSVHLYDVTPPSAQADNAAWTLAQEDLAAYVDVIALGTPADLGGGSFIKTQLADQQDYKLAEDRSSLWARLVTTPAFTPGEVARQVTLLGIVL